LNRNLPFLTPYQKKNQINFAYTAPLRLSKARPPADEHIKPQNAAPNISCNIKKSTNKKTLNKLLCHFKTEKIMMSKKKNQNLNSKRLKSPLEGRMPEQIIQSRQLTLDFSRPYTIIKTQFNYSAAEDMALEFVYKLAPCIADKLNIDTGNVILIAISKNNKVVIFCENSRYRDWLYNFFEQPSLGSAQFYDDVDPALIIEKLDILFEH